MASAQLNLSNTGSVPTATTDLAGNPLDSLGNPLLDTVQSDTVKATEEPPQYVMRNFDHKNQVIVGSVVMFCVALALVSMNNYNPRR